MNKMPIPKRSQTRQRELRLFSYRNALERGDFGTVAEILEEAERDPELSQMLTEMQSGIEREVPPPENKRKLNVTTTTQRIPWLPLPMPSLTRYFSLAVTVSALVAIAMLLYTLYPHLPPTPTAGLGAQNAACQGQVSDAAGLTAAINLANDETQCPGRDTIIVTAGFNVDQVDATSTDLGGKSAFPDITSDIAIVSSDANVKALTGSKKARFFYIDANQHAGRLALVNIELSGGQAGNGGAILVNGTSSADNADTQLYLINTSIHDNSATAGGAIRIQAGGNTHARVLIMSSLLDKNSAQQGGAIMTDVRDGGLVELVLVNSRLSNNTSTNEGGAMYTNMPKGNVVLTAIKTEFLSNTAGNSVQCFTNSGTLTFAVDSDNASTDASCGNTTVTADAGTPFAQNACLLPANDVQGMIDAINKSNGEECPGADIITVNNSLQPTAGYNNGDTAFPAIKGTLLIDGGNTMSENNTISRDASAPAFRFFTVDGTNGGNANLILQNIVLTGGANGNGVAAGAILVDGNTNGKATIGISNVTFNNNSAAGGNGGAVATFSQNGGFTNAVITRSTFNGNSAAYGGAFYSGGFDGGNATAVIAKSTFSSNTAETQGGAVYNNGLNGKATMTVMGSSFATNSAPAGGAIYNNGRANGSAELTIDGTTTSQGNTAATAGAAIYSEGATGNAPVTGTKGNMTATENTCFDDTFVAAACP